MIEKFYPYVVLAYMGAWVFCFIYLIVLSMKSSQLKKELELLKSTVAKKET